MGTGGGGGGKRGGSGGKKPPGDKIEMESYPKRMRKMIPVRKLLLSWM